MIVLPACYHTCLVLMFFWHGNIPTSHFLLWGRLWEWREEINILQNNRHGQQMKGHHKIPVSLLSCNECPNVSFYTPAISFAKYENFTKPNCSVCASMQAILCVNLVMMSLSYVTLLLWYHVIVYDRESSSILALTDLYWFNIPLTINRYNATLLNSYQSKW